MGRYLAVRPHIENAARTYGVNSRYLTGLMYLESIGFQQGIVSPTGAAGLGQITKGTWRQIVRQSKHPELQAISHLNDNQLLLKRFDPHLNALATAEYVGVAYDKIKRAFAKHGVRDADGHIPEPTMVELYSFHNTGNAAMAVAARKGQTIGQAPILNQEQKQSAIQNNPSLYSDGMNTPAQKYMELAGEKIKQGIRYHSEFLAKQQVVSNYRSNIVLLDQFGKQIKDPNIVEATSQLYADTSLGGRLGGISDGTSVVRKKEESKIKDPYEIYNQQAKNPEFVQGERPMQGTSIQEKTITAWAWSKASQAATPNQTPEGVQDAFNFGTNQPYVADPAAFRMQEKIQKFGEKLIESARNPEKGTLYPYYLEAKKSGGSVKLPSKLLTTNTANEKIEVAWGFGYDFKQDAARASWPFGRVGLFLRDGEISVDKQDKIKINGTMVIKNDTYDWTPDAKTIKANLAIFAAGETGVNGPYRNDISSPFPFQAIPSQIKDERSDYQKKIDLLSGPKNQEKPLSKWSDKSKNIDKSLDIKYNRSLRFSTREK